MNDSYLQHWGIKGMKWGVRRFRNEDGTLTEAGKKRYSDDGGITYKPSQRSQEYSRRFGINGNLSKTNAQKRLERNKVYAQKSKEQAANDAKREEYRRASENRRTLSDEELKQRINRLQMEKQLKDLTDQNIQSSGRRAVNEILSTSGKRIAGAVLVGAAMYAGKAIVTGEFDPQQAAAYIFANPNKKK